MRIGLFTDTYRPTINGVVFVVETLKNQLESMGHEVFVFCPARTIRPGRQESEDDHIVRIPSVKSGFFDDFDFTLFFPPTMLRRIRDLELDIVHVFTPSQVGLLGVNAAVRHNTPLVVQHCTDLYEFAENYPSTFPGALALVGIVFPMSVKLDGRDIREIVKMYRPRSGITKWSQAIIAKAITMLYSKADATIVLSRKSFRQLKRWQDSAYRYELTLLPNGVNAIATPKPAVLRDFREQWGLHEHDEVFGFVGRLGEEKNLPVLIQAMDKIGRERPHAKLLFVGDFDYRETLEKLAADSKYPERIIFTGALPREELGVVYAALDVFTFPSLKDTQGWVLHEAAHAGLPIVLIDREVSEVVEDGKSGYYARNSAADIARKVTTLLKSPKKREQFGARSKQLAARFTEKTQTQKLAALYAALVANHGRKKPQRKRRLAGIYQKISKKIKGDSA